MDSLSVEKSALYYLSRNWSVIPVHAVDKRPLIRWQQYQYRRASESDVKQWFRRWPRANVGIVTEIVSGLIVLDIDPKHGGSDSLAVLEQAHGALPHTIESATGGGGRHIYLAHPGGVIHNRAGLARGVDLRGDGGYVVAPPSLHVSGRRYAWLAAHEPEHAKLAPMPAWLLHRVTEGRRVGYRLHYWRRLLRKGVVEGERNSTIASLAGHLLWHGVDADVALELLLSWNVVRCQPPLTDDEVVRTVENIARLHERENKNTHLPSV